MNKIQEIIEEIDKKNLQNKYINTLDLIKYVESFIKRKQLIIYGGFAINLLIPKKDKFYKEYTMNDLDCFSPNAKQDAMELAKELSDNNYKYIKVRKALHENTYKVYADFVQIIDLTQLDNNTFNNLKNISEYEKKNTELYKYYEDSYVIAPVILLKANMHYELARPRSSYFRWEKIYNRLALVNSFYPTEKNKKVLKCIPIKESYLNAIKYILEYIKDNKLPIIDSYSIKLYTNLSLCCYRLSNDSICVTILVKNIRDVYLNIKKIIDLYVNNSKYRVEVIKNPIDSINLYKYYDIKIFDKETGESFNMLRIIKIKDQCFSTTVKNGYSVGSIDTCLYFLYYNYVNNKIYKNNMKDAMENIYYINQFENNVLDDKLNKTPINKRLQINCYGEINRENELKEIWNQRLTLKYF